MSARTSRFHSSGPRVTEETFLRDGTGRVVVSARARLSEGARPTAHAAVAVRLLRDDASVAESVPLRRIGEDLVLDLHSFGTPSGGRFTVQLYSPSGAVLTGRMTTVYPVTQDAFRALPDQSTAAIPRPAAPPDPDSGPVARQLAPLASLARAELVCDVPERSAIVALYRRGTASRTDVESGVVPATNAEVCVIGR